MSARRSAAAERLRARKLSVPANERRLRGRYITKFHFANCQCGGRVSVLASDKCLRGRRALRDSCISLYGKERIDQLGFLEQTPRNPRVLLNVARKLIELLQSSDYALPPPLFGNLGLDPQAMVEVIEAEIRVLEESLANVDEELKKAQSTQGAKGEKVETYKEGFFWIARWLEASFALAGMMHESERVKPSLRRRGRTEVEPEPDGTVPEPEPTPEPGEDRDRPEP